MATTTATEDDNDDGISCFIQTEIHIATAQSHRKLKNKNDIKSISFAITNVLSTKIRHGKSCEAALFIKIISITQIRTTFFLVVVPSALVIPVAFHSDLLESLFYWNVYSIDLSIICFLFKLKH